MNLVNKETNKTDEQVFCTLQTILTDIKCHEDSCGGFLFVWLFVFSAQKYCMDQCNSGFSPSQQYKTLPTALKIFKPLSGTL